LAVYHANLDFHYLIPVVPRLTVYPILGATMIRKKEDYTGEQITVTNYDESEWGADLGAGVQFDLCRNWFVHADYIYKWVDGPRQRKLIEQGEFSLTDIKRSSLSVGVGFRF